MALITNLLIRSGLMRGGPSTPEPAVNPPAGEEAPELIVYVDDLNPEALAQLEADGLVHLEEEFIEPIGKPSTKVVRLKDLMSNAALERKEQNIETDLAEQLGLNATLEEVLSASNLQATPDEWSIDRALNWLADKRNKVPADELASAFKEALVHADVSESRVFSDAALRDRAIDKYESILKTKISAQLATLQGQRDELMERMKTLEGQVNAIQENEQALQNGLDRWCETKAQTERDWAEVINLLIPGAGSTIIGGRDFGEKE